MDAVVTRVSARSTAILKRTMITRGGRKKKNSSASSSSACSTSSLPADAQTRKERKPRQKRKTPDTPAPMAVRKRRNTNHTFPALAGAVLPLHDFVKLEPGQVEEDDEEEEEEEHGRVTSPEQASDHEMTNGEKGTGTKGDSEGEEAGKKPTRARSARGGKHHKGNGKAVEKDAFKCPFCDHRSGRPNNLVIHINSKHMEESAPRTCSQDPAECVGESILYFLSTKKEFEEKVAGLEAQVSLCHQTLGEVLAELTIEQKERLQEQAAQKQNALLTELLQHCTPASQA